jgi:hypothetical protein
MSGNVLQRNIICYRNEKAKLFRFSNVNFDYNKSDYNLVYHFGQPMMTGYFAAKETAGPNLAPNPGFEEGRASRAGERHAVPAVAQGSDSAYREVGEFPKDWRWQVQPTPTTKAYLTDQGARTGKGALRIEGGPVQLGRRRCCRAHDRGST